MKYLPLIIIISMMALWSYFCLTAGSSISSKESDWPMFQYIAEIRNEVEWFFGFMAIGIVALIFKPTGCNCNKPASTPMSELYLKPQAPPPPNPEEPEGNFGKSIYGR